MNHTLIFNKSYSIYHLAAQLITDFPKKDRYSLGVKIESILLELLASIITAEVTVNALKDRALIETTIKSEIATILIRSAMERKCIEETNYFKLTEPLREITKMSMGWRKSLIHK